jgi:hypothetical protein
MDTCALGVADEDDATALVLVGDTSSRHRPRLIAADTRRRTPLPCSPPEAVRSEVSALAIIGASAALGPARGHGFTHPIHLVSHEIRLPARIERHGGIDEETVMVGLDAMTTRPWSRRP